MAYTLNAWRTWLARNDTFVFPIAVALVMRLLLSGFAALIVMTGSYVIKSPLDPLYHGLTPLDPVGWNVLVAPFQRWDAVWYELIATHGYSSTDLSAAFFPLYPFVTRMLMPVTGGALQTGLLVSTLAVSAAFILFYQMAQQLYGRQAARLGLIAWAAFPTSFFLFVPYTEALFVVFALACLYAAQQKNWLLAGILGGLAALARWQGTWLAVPLGIEWLMQARTMPWRTRLLTVLTIGLAPLGLALYMLYLQLAFGDAFLWVHALAAWNTVFIPPWETLVLTVREILFGDPGSLANNLVDLGTTLFVFGLVLVGTINSKIRLPVIYIVYGLLLTIVPISTMAQGFGFDVLPLGSSGRRIMIIFPAFMVAGVLLNKRRLFVPVYLALALGLQFILLYAFVNWLWVD